MQSTILFGVAIALGAPALKDPPNKLAGEWKLVSIDMFGQRNTFETDDRMVMTEDGKLGRNWPAPEIRWARYTHTTNAAQGSIDWIDRSSDAKEQVSQGLFELEGNTLRICFNHAPQTRPLSICHAPGSWDYVMVFNRVDPSERRIKLPEKR